MTIPHLPRSPAYRKEFGPPSESRPTSSPFKVLARVLLIGAICAAPWAFGAVEPWAWASLMVVALTALVLWAAGCAHRGVLRITWSPLYWPFLGLLALGALQLFAGLNADHVATREAVLKIVTNLILFFLAGQLLNAQSGNGGALEWFGLMVSVLALAVCLEALAQLFLNPNPQLVYWSFPATGWPFGPYVNHNDYAGLMEMLLPISVAYILSRSAVLFLRILLWCAVILSVISVWMSESRGGALVLLVEGVLWVGVLLWSRPRSVSPRAAIVFVGAMLVAAGLFSWLVSRGHVGGRAWSIFETHSSVEATLGDRGRVGIDTLHLVRSHPWLGVGVGCFQYVIPEYITFPTDLQWSHAHDDILEAAAETGLPGVALMLVAIWLFFRVAFRRVRRRLRYSWGWIQTGAAVGSVGLFVHSFVDFNLRIPANAAWFVICLSIATHARLVPPRAPIMVWDASGDRNPE